MVAPTNPASIPAKLVIITRLENMFMCSESVSLFFVLLIYHETNDPDQNASENDIITASITSTRNELANVSNNKYRLRRIMLIWNEILCPNLSPTIPVGTSRNKATISKIESSEFSCT